MTQARPVKQLRIIWISALLTLTVGGCAHHGPQVLPEPHMTVADVYRGKMGQNSTDLNHLRIALNASDDRLQRRFRYGESFGSPSETKFKKVRNPDISIYIYPHLARAGGSEVMIPGYTTMFTLYEGNHYALPGERAQ